MEGSMFKILEFIVISSFSQVILLIFILFVMKRNRKANAFFAAYLFIFVSIFFAGFLSRAGVKVLALIFGLISVPALSLLGALIFFYSVYVTGLRKKFRRVDIAPLIVYVLNFAIFLTYVMNELYLSNTPSFGKMLYIVVTSGLATSIIYLVYTIMTLGKYYRRIENYYSDLERMRLDWLMKITTLSFFVVTVWFCEFGLTYFNIIPRTHFIPLFIMIMIMIIIFITSYYLINQPEIFRKNLEMEHALVEDTDPGDPAATKKYARQSIDDRMQDEYLARLNTHMDQHKPFLDENITIKDLADEIDIPPHHLSIVINNRLSKNFYTFINEYRIKEAVSILDDPDNSEASIIAIAFRAGFNSKSTFNSVFKKITGLTPSEYRNRSSLGSELAS